MKTDSSFITRRARDVRTAFTAAAAAVAICLVSAIVGNAEQRELKTENTTEKVDAVLVLDSSGSMRVTDPLRLRDEGAKLFAQFLKEGDRLGIIDFSDDAKVIRPLTPFDPKDAGALAKDIERVGQDGQYTDLLAAVKGGREALERDARKDVSRVMILLSDGKMEPNPKAGAPKQLTDELLNGVLPELKATGIRIYTLAFSNEVDKDLLSQISAATDGIHWFTPTADKIHESFASLFLAVKKPQVVPLTSKGFKIDQDIQEATFYVNRTEGAEVSLRQPSGKTLTAASQSENVKWFRGQKFDVITVSQPEVGDWQILGLPSGDGFATVLTNLKLVTDWPTSITAGDTAVLQARLYDNDKPVVLPEMTGVGQYAFQVSSTDKISEPIVKEFLVDDGKNGDKIAKDGIFSARVKIDEPGEYRMRVVARGPTFERNQQIPFRVKPELLTLSVVHANEHAEGKESHEPDAFHVQLSPDALALKKVEIKIQAVDANRRRFNLPVTGEGGKYESSSRALPHDGEYEITALLTGETKSRKDIKASSKELTYKQVSATGEAHAVEEVVVPKNETPVGSPPIWPYLIVVTVLNTGAGFVALTILKKGQAEMTFVTPDFQPPPEILKAIADLEQRLTVTEVDLTDPVFAEDGATPPVPPTPAAAQAEQKPGGESAAPGGEEG